jgi:hypothetical protein
MQHWQSAIDKQAPDSIEAIVRILPRQYLRVLSKPSVATFAQELGNAGWGIVYVQLLGWIVAFALLGLLVILIASLVLGIVGNLNFTVLATTFGLIISLALFIPTLLLIGTVLTHLIARAFGGHGTFLVQLYASLLFQMPLSAIASLLMLIPTAGILLGIVFAFGAFIYGMVLQLYAVIAVHRLNARTAVAAVFIPATIALILTWSFAVWWHGW